MFDSSIVWYLFLGGTGAGALSVLAGADLLFWRHGERPARHLAWTTGLTRSFLARGLAVSTMLLALGALCLLTDLGHPERFFYVLVHPTASVLTFGSYVLAGTVLCAAFLCSIALFNLTRIPALAIRIVEALAIVLGFCTMAYTGVFLADIGCVALWGNPLLPVLFTFSSLSCGTMCVLACALFEAPERKGRLVDALVRIDALAIVLELVSLAAYLAYGALLVNGSQTIGVLVSGDLRDLFWMGFVCLGMVLPLAIDAAYTRMGTAALPALAIPLILIGGYLLRYCMVNAPYG